VDHAADCLDRGPVYIHCASGHSRSAVVAAALLVRLQRAGTLEEALAQIRKRRPRANPTPQQRRVAELAI
jgi:protein-tyrosine phosphatase